MEADVGDIIYANDNRTRIVVAVYGEKFAYNWFEADSADVVHKAINPVAFFYENPAYTIVKSKSGLIKRFSKIWKQQTS